MEKVKSMGLEIMMYENGTLGMQEPTSLVD